MDFGAYLRQTREGRGVSLRDIAATTKISVSALEALERNDVARLPGGIFTRAFVRAYAAEVGLDAEVTVQEFLTHFPLEGVTQGSRYEALEPDESPSGGWPGAGVAAWAAGLLLSVIAGIVYLAATSSGPAQAAPDRPVSEAAPTARIERVASPPTAAVAPEPRPPAAPPARADTLTLRLHPAGPCWVSATLDGLLVFSRLMRAGEDELLEARDEIVIKIGDAGAFDFTLNRQPGRSLGAPGQVVTARITSDNYLDFVAR